MQRRFPVCLLAIAITACSETPIEEQGPEAIAEMEKQIESDALSLEQAADEAVKILEEDIADDLAAEGITTEQPEPIPEN
ncbi:hypothetical protein [Parasphingorhabdus sp.]|uniref:hypothetical protein n=1 Tax=Parasphingorhabdus sp. TaxID=2709688 RepID=UPI003263E56E